jgi:hypothetical protein
VSGRRHAGAGADSIDDMDLLRHGAMPGLFSGLRAPSTLGSFLRSFTWGNVLQPEKASRLLLAELARQAPLLPGGDVLASWTSIPHRNGSAGMLSRAPRSGTPRSRLRHEAPCHIPGAAGRNSEGGFWA